MKALNKNLAKKLIRYLASEFGAKNICELLQDFYARLARAAGEDIELKKKFEEIAAAFQKLKSELPVKNAFGIRDL